MDREAEPVSKTGVKYYLLWIVLVGAFLVAYVPVMTDLVFVWSSSDDYSHGFLVVPIALYAVWRKRDSINASVFIGSWFGFAVAVLSLATYIFASAGEILTLAAISMVGFIAGSVLFLFGFRVFRLCLFPVLFLLFMIPVPAQIYAVLTVPLQLFVTRATALLATFAAIPVFCEGNVIHHSRGTFEVVQACSGLRSIVALLMLGAVFGYFTLGSNIHRLIIFLSAIPIAVAVNILRVFAMVAFIHFLGIDLTEGFPHTMLGVTIFCVAAGVFLLLRKGLALWEW